MTILQAEHPLSTPGLAELSALVSRRAAPPSEGMSNWADAISLAVRHGLGPVAFRRINRSGGEWGVPPCDLQTLRSAFIEAAYRGAKTRADAILVLDTLHRAGVETIALKGLHLAAAWYDEFALRSMTDIDLLIRPAQVRMAWDALRECGYAGAEGGFVDRASRAPRHLPRLSKRNATPIELHWTIGTPGDPFDIDTARLWERSRVIQVGTHPTSALCPEDLLLHLCLHAVHQHLCRIPLRSIYDIAVVTCRQGDAMDWDLLARTAHAFGTRRPVFCGLLLAREIFGAEVPRSILNSLDPEADHDQLVRLALAAMESFDSHTPGWLRLVAAEGQVPKNLCRLAIVGLGIRAIRPDSPPVVTRGSTLRGYVRRLLQLWGRYHRLLVQLALSPRAARAHLQRARAIASFETWLLSPGEGKVGTSVS